MLANLGGIHHQLGELQQAHERYEEALALHREVRNRRSEAILRCNLGRLAAERGRVDEANAHLERAVAFGRETSSPFVEGVAEAERARVALGTADLDMAVVALDAAEGLLRSVSGGDELGKVLCLRVEIFVAHGAQAAAGRALGHARTCAAELGGSDDSELQRELQRVTALFATTWPQP